MLTFWQSFLPVVMMCSSICNAQPGGGGGYAPLEPVDEYAPWTNNGYYYQASAGNSDYAPEASSTSAPSSSSASSSANNGYYYHQAPSSGYNSYYQAAPSSTSAPSSSSSAPSSTTVSSPSTGTCNLNPSGNVRAPRREALQNTARITAAQANFAYSSRPRFRAQFNAIDFKFDVFAKFNATAPATGGRGAAVAVDDMPALKDEGVGMNYVELEPCGVNLAHVHPRATELIFLVSGETLDVFFVEERNERLVRNVLTPGQMTIFPRGLLHGQANRSCKTAIITAFFGHEDFGSWFAGENLLDSPPVFAATALGQDFNTVEQLRNAQPTTVPARGRDPECLSRCGIL